MSGVGKPLNAATLRELDIPAPAYDRSQVTAGVVHIGVGGFHRAHQAVYLDRLLDSGATEWGVCGVGTRPADRRMRDVLLDQDGLYTVALKHPDGRFEPRVVGSLIDYLYAPDDAEAVIERLASPGTHIVSLTITEGGYQVDPLTGQFAATEPDVLLDLEPGATPRSVLGLVVEALKRRRARGIRPFSVMSCDNVPGNGSVARTSFSGFAAMRDPDLGAWVRHSVAFPNSMVDRITPTTSDEDRALLAEQFGVRDAWPVACEPYSQWVLEDSFSDGRPPLEDVGVQLVDDVVPYELMKLRLLNAGHQAIAYLGYLAGYRYSDKVCGDPVFAAFLLAYMEREATPTLPPVPGVDLDQYRHTLLARFANPYVRDTLARLCSESSDRIPAFVLPVVRDRLAAGGDVSLAALIVAGWARYAEGTDDSGRPIEVVDRMLEAVTAAAARSRAQPDAFLRDTGVFGELAANERFVAAFSAGLASLRDRGARATVADTVARLRAGPG
ncbi:MAG: mannitol dehydrogenase family protein [Actinomycetota bacterium]|nr:mannitol dehydrogenase family protein [Actinomycetota bacterium]